MQAVTPELFRLLCGHFTTGVTVVTTRDAGGAPTGMTVTSFASVSLDPPLISVAIGREATIYAELRASARFTVNILASHQETLSRRFAESVPNRFDGVGWSDRAGGFVVLDDALAHLTCEKVHEFEAGDHTILVGRVVGGGVSEEATPLLHYRGGYISVGE